MKFKSIFLSVLVLFISFASLSYAREMKGVNLPDNVTIEGKKCQLNGMGIRKKFFISVYVCGLYLEAPSNDEKKIISSEQVKRMVLKFIYKKVEKEKLVETWNEGFENNSAPVNSALQTKIKQFNSFFDSDIAGGEEIVLTYIPGKGTEVSFRGKVKGTIEGKDFMEAVFKIWLGNKPADSDLKKGLMGR